MVTAEVLDCCQVIHDYTETYSACRLCLKIYNPLSQMRPLLEIAGAAYAGLSDPISKHRATVCRDRGWR